MTPSLEKWPTKAKSATSPHDKIDPTGHQATILNMDSIGVLVVPALKMFCGESWAHAASCTAAQIKMTQQIFQMESSKNQKS